VETTINPKYRFLAGLAFFVIIFAGCNQSNDLGMELLPSTDLIEVKSVVLKESFSSFTHREDSIKTDEQIASLLGSFNDPIFGNSTINYAAQFRLKSFPDFGTNAEVDSIKLFLYYQGIYGDTTSNQTIKVYELESSIDKDEDYTNTFDLKSLASNVPVGQISLNPKSNEIDDNVRNYELMEIPLDISLGEKLINLDSTVLSNNDVFLKAFKGLYIASSGIIEGDGAIIRFKSHNYENLKDNQSLFSAILSALTITIILDNDTIELSVDSFDDIGVGYIQLYYNNDENKLKEEQEKLFHYYFISENSARINSITHNYSGTPFEANLNSETEEDSLIYVQPNGGLQSKIFIENLTNWQDSTNTAINKAELIFQIDTAASQVDKFAPPSQLLFTVIDENGDEFLPIDYLFSPSFYGGYLYPDYTYRFNITQHLQQIIEGKAENYGFFLTTAQKSSEANRVVLKGSTSETGIKLIITYSKFLQ
jgi:hypothetical protein